MPKTPVAERPEHPTRQPLPDLISLRELSEMLSLTGIELRRLLKRNKLPAPSISVGTRHKWWQRDAIAAWLAGQEASRATT